MAERAPTNRTQAPTVEEEVALLEQGYCFIAGLDEAGRGCLAGPVVAAAVILPLEEDHLPLFAGVRDSKQLLPHARESLYQVIIDPTASSPARRPHALRHRSTTALHHQRRCFLPLYSRGIYHSQGHPRPAHAAIARAVPRLWLRSTQGLLYRGTPGSSARTRCLSYSPQDLCTCARPAWAVREFLTGSILVKVSSWR